MSKLSHIIEPIKDEDPEILRRVEEDLSVMDYDDPPYKGECKAVGKMLHRAIMYLEDLKADKG